MKKAFLALLSVAVLTTTSCYSLHHTVGTGAQGAAETEERQWYALWGLVPLGKIDSKSLAGTATNYSVHTEWSFLDIVINIFTGFVTITSRTITVTK